MRERIDHPRVVGAGVSMRVNLRMKARTGSSQNEPGGVPFVVLGAPLFEKSHDRPGPGPLEGQVQAGIEQGIVAQRGKVLRVLTQDTEVLAGAAELQIVAA